VLNCYNIYNKKDKDLQMSFIECLEENNGLIRDYDVMRKGGFGVIVEDLEEANKILKPYMDKIDYILSYDAYVKCDICHLIVDIEDSHINEDGDIVCDYCDNIDN